MDKYGLGQRLTGRVSIITGAGGGIGGYAAHLFAAHGSTVICTDLNLEAAKNTAESVRAEGGTAVPIGHDVSDGASWDAVVAATLSNFGRIDVLVNNAAIHSEEAMGDITDESWRRSLEVNLTGPFLGMQRVIPSMLKHGKGVIINVCSIAALIGASFAHYSASKGGLRSLTRTAAVAYAKQGIRVNAIFPGLIETKLTADALANPGIRSALESANALPRFGRPQDIGFGLLYLASDESSFATGADFIVDGGVTAK